MTEDLTSVLRTTPKLRNATKHLMLNTISNLRRPVAAAIAVIALMTVAPCVSQGSAITFYTTRASFNTAEPGLPVETFQAANFPKGQLWGTQASPLNASTNYGFFSTGSILPGLTISNLNPLNTPGLVVYNDGAIQVGGTKSVGTNWYGDTLVLNFAPGVSAVGTDVFAFSAYPPAQTLAGNFTVNVYNGTTLLGTTNVDVPAAGDFGFVGVSSTTPITSMTLLYIDDEVTTLVDNVAFGSQVDPAPEPPTMVSALTAALVGVRFAVSRRGR